MAMVALEQFQWDRRENVDEREDFPCASPESNHTAMTT